MSSRNSLAQLPAYLQSRCSFSEALSHPTVNYAATLPGMQGVIVAFIAEFVIAFVLMSVVLRVSNTPHIARYTGLFAGALVATYITLESPLSGMSMNPARTFGSAFVGHIWVGLWIYFTAPVLAMQLAAADLSPRQGRSLLREISSLQSAPLHL